MECEAAKRIKDRKKRVSVVIITLKQRGFQCISSRKTRILESNGHALSSDIDLNGSQLRHRYSVRHISYPPVSNSK